MTKKAISGLVVVVLPVAVSTWVPWVAVLALGAVLLLTATVMVVVLTAARGRDERQQRNSARVLDRLLNAIGRKLPPEP